MGEVQALKKANNKLRRELAEAKLERDQLFPVCLNLTAQKIKRWPFVPTLMQVVAAVREFLDCPICFNFMNSPVTCVFQILIDRVHGLNITSRLPCGHTFCKACFNAVSEAQKTHKYDNEDLAKKALTCYRCPNCRRFTDRNIIPTTIYGLHDILAILETD